MKYLEDHGLPLVQLKELRRELIVALAGRNDPISNFEIAQIASLQQAIAAMEAVVDDLDSRIEPTTPARKTIYGFGLARARAAGKPEFIFGRRSQSDRNHELCSVRAG